MQRLANQGYVLMAITAVMWSGNAVIGRAVQRQVITLDENR